MTPDIVIQVAFVTGKILHKGTGRPVDGRISITAQEGPVLSKTFDDGTFVVSGRLKTLFPKLNEEGYTLNLTVRAISDQYRAGFIDFNLPVIDIAQIPDFDYENPVEPDPFVDVGTVLLPADPIYIRGRVVEAMNPTQPVDSASVEVNHQGAVIAPVTTSADGLYEFKDIEIEAPAKISCSNGIETITRSLLIDYGRMVHEENFRLPV